MDITTQINLDGTVTIDAKGIQVTQMRWDSATRTARPTYYQGDMQITIEVKAVVSHLFVKALHAPGDHAGAMSWAVRAKASNVTETAVDPPSPLKLVP
jgi:hypothetical protein